MERGEYVARLVRWSVRGSVIPLLINLLGATYAVYVFLGEGDRELDGNALYIRGAADGDLLPSRSTFGVVIWRVDSLSQRGKGEREKEREKEKERERKRQKETERDKKREKERDRER